VNGEATAIEVVGLARSFGETLALKSVDLVLESGGVFGLLGPNGAGKTTTVRILTGVLRPDSAQTLRVLGHEVPHDVERVRPRVGVQTDTALYERLTALDNLTFFGALYGMPKADALRSAEDLLCRFGLSDRSSEKVGAYSKGMRQKVLIARALIADPDLVFLDEPTAGLDPEAAHELMTYVHDLSREAGKTFFITSHRLEEMESVCTKVGILADGSVVAQGSPAEVASAIVPEIRVRVAPAPGAQLDLVALGALAGVVRARRDDGGAIVEVSARDAIPTLVRQIAAMPADLLAVAEEPPTLEEAYLRLMRPRNASAEEVEAA
jgi:ABC-2 type transport system ATP-binding protein